MKYIFQLVSRLLKELPRELEKEKVKILYYYHTWVTK